MWYEILEELAPPPLRVKKDENADSGFFQNIGTVQCDIPRYSNFQSLLREHIIS
jgi:hypothetical protein